MSAEHGEFDAVHAEPEAVDAAPGAVDVARRRGDHRAGAGDQGGVPGPRRRALPTRNAPFHTQAPP